MLLLILIIFVIVVAVVSISFGRWLQRKGTQIEREHRPDEPPR